MSSGAGSQPQQPAPIETMPTVYTEPGQPPTESTVDVDFLKGVGGILKVVEMVFSLVVFICASVSALNKDACGWIQFVSMTAFVLTIMLYIFHAFKLPPKFARSIPFKFCEFCYYAVFTLFYFISGVVAACFATGNAALSAAAFFAFASMCVFGADIYFRFVAWRHSNEGPFFSSGATQGVTLP